MCVTKPTLLPRPPEGPIRWPLKRIRVFSDTGVEIQRYEGSIKVEHGENYVIIHLNEKSHRIINALVIIDDL